MRYTRRGTGSVEPARISDRRPNENDRKTAPKNTNHRSGEEQSLYCTLSKDSEYIRQGPGPINPKIRHTFYYFFTLLYFFYYYRLNFINSTLQNLLKIIKQLKICDLLQNVNMPMRNMLAFSHKNAQIPKG